MSKVAAVFTPEGQLAKAIEGFQPRDAQLTMAQAIEKSIRKKGTLVVEAETGTGKTFAYLAPVLQAKGKAIVSTGTKALQEQLYHRDLPTLRAALAPEKVIALLKGRSNYLCTHRLEQAQLQAGQFNSETQTKLVKVKRWSTQTRDGDIGELVVLQDDPQLTALVTSTKDNCLGRECPNYDDCYLVKARDEAKQADVVVVNHHLFFADLAIKDTGFGEIIPESDMVVFDEAHQVPDIASQYFGDSLSSRQLIEIADEVQRLCLTELKDLAQAAQMARILTQVVRDWRLQFPSDPTRGNWRDKRDDSSMTEVCSRVAEKLTLFIDVIKTARGRHKEMDSLIERAEEAYDLWQQLMQTDQTGYSFWYETTVRHIVLHQTPLSVAKRFGNLVKHSDRGWVFTSATLSVNEKFDYFVNRLGLWDAETLVLASPFDFEHQAMLCLPRYLPPANQFNRDQRLAQLAQQCIEANQGGTFLLFTSHSMLKRVANLLDEKLDRPVLVQGEGSKRSILQKFTDAGNAVLLGTSSFWEGVDVRGAALRCVIIDKLPFASPDDPLLNARVEDAKLRGVDAFHTIQLPEAIIALKQGAGRLIRDQRDSGVLIVCDDRLVTRQYGARFIKSLPPMARTRDLSRAMLFLKDTYNETNLASH